MRFSESWLRTWVNPPVDTATLADQLSMAGLEVDAVEPVAPAFDGVVVGRVDSLEPHPAADKLRVCQVEVGAGEPLQIVCGAANVAAGMRVPVALVGARLPGDLRIKKARLRGVASFGMICSAAELGLEETSAGILPLPAEAPVGEDFRAWLELDDQAIEVDLTPDRGDCLSIAGIAREVGVLDRVAVTPVAVAEVPAAVERTVAVAVDAPEACPRYLCRVVCDLDVRAETPLWMRERLRRSGLRSLGAVVDVTNYVLLELGQPMHAFDLERIGGGIRVRMAAAGESLELLDGQTVTLDGDSLVIADQERPLALAGIMGGAASAVGEGTRDVLLESAFFAPRAIAGRARAYGLHTDASHRFERGVDPGLQRRALERATALLLEICGGRPGPVVEAASAAHLPRPPQVPLRPGRIARVLGLEVADAEVEDILGRLGMSLERTAAGWRVTPPSARFDIAIEADLIEEVGRIHGYARIPMTHAAAETALQAVPEGRLDLDRARLALVDRGYQEAVTYSFVAPEIQRLLDPDSDPLALANPLSNELSVMRTGLWPGLLQALAYNRARQQDRIRLFESGLRFRPSPEGLRQEPGLAALAVGPVFPEHWDGGRGRDTDFYDLKGDLEAVLALGGAAGSFAFEAATHPALHPGQSARVLREGEPMGWIGMLHPRLRKALDLDCDPLLFEIDLQAATPGRLPSFRPLSKYPAIRRDLALVIPREVTWERVRATVMAAAPPILQAVRLFDVYTGEHVEAGRKSIALGLILQDSSHTLKDSEVEAVVAAVVDRLVSDLDARLRA